MSEVTTLKQVQEQYPHLSKTGFEDWHPMKPAGVWIKRYAMRDSLTSDDGEEQFAAAVRWLQARRPRKTVNPKASSYGIKHIAENSEGRYISNGALIAAALAIGLTVAQIFGTPNARIGVSLEDR